METLKQFVSETSAQEWAAGIVVLLAVVLLITSAAYLDLWERAPREEVRHEPSDRELPSA